MRELSRKELYDLVWQQPLSKTAPQFGISATKLAEICRNYEVPYPGSLYWTMKSMGRPVEIQPLPAAEAGSTQISIEPAKPRRPRAEKSEEKPQHPDAQDVIERLPTNEHPIVTRLITEREQRRREALASGNKWAIEKAPGPITEVDRRRHFLLSKLFYAVEERGGKVSAAQKGNFLARIDGEDVEFLIREKRSQRRVVSDLGGFKSTNIELVGTGRLSFSFLTYSPSHPCSEWNETDTTKLESRFPAMVDRIFAGAQGLKAWNLQRQLEEEQRRKAAADRAERQRLAELERARRQRLVELASDWQAANVIRGLITALKSTDFAESQDVSGRTLAEWFAWANDVANDLDATRDGAVNLFPTIGREKR